MKNKAYNLSRYTFSSSEKILFDANIWLYLFPPPGNPQHHFASIYSIHFARMLRDGAQPVLDPLVLSEYLNRYCHIEWEGKYKKTHIKYKEFRNSSDFKPVGKSAASFARKILSLCARHAITSEGLDIEKALSEFETGESDFNDALIVDVCKINGFKLLTNDADFRTGGIEVLTTNSKLLSACQ
jgi:predicted nucleic acid-binding protein